jgi:hypothetical protein
MKIHQKAKSISSSIILVIAWANFILFMFTILPWVSGLSRDAGLTTSIDTNFSFDPSAIYPIVASYGADGRLFYIIQRWTFDLIWPLVYAWPLFVTLKLFPIGMLALLPWLATALDYLENSVFTILVVLYPLELSWLPILGVLMSLLKWIALGTSMVLTLIIPFYYGLFRQKLVSKS